MGSKKSIAIDMDGVIADVEVQFLKWYERDYGIKINRDQLLGLSEEDAFPEKTAVRKFANTPGFFSSLPVMQDAVESVKSLTEKYNIYIVSAAMEFPNSLLEKFSWLNEHFPFISWRNIIFCGDKSIIDTDYLIDDHCKNLDFFKGKTIMFTSFHNVNLHHHKRAKNWKEVLSLFKDGY